MLHKNWVCMSGGLPGEDGLRSHRITYISVALFG